MAEIELPERPPPIPRPGRVRPWFVFITLMVVSMSLYWSGTTREALFFSGVMATLAGMNWASHRMEVRHWKRLQGELDDMYDAVVLRATMIEKLVERHGPREAIELMQMADHLVSEGDFPDIKAAVASIERHHDFDPTIYEDE